MMRQTGHSEPDSKGSNPLRRVALVLDTVAFSSSGLTLHDIAEAAQIPASTTHRIVNSLLDIGYLESDANHKVYRSGPRLRRLLNLSFGDTSIEKMAMPLLKELANGFNEVSFISRLIGGKIKLEAFALPDEAPFSLIHPGYEFPFHATATGKAILAFQTDAFIETALSGDMPRFQATTSVDRSELLERLGKIRSQGYAINDMEFDPGIYALAAPITLQYNGVFLSVGLVGMRDRMLAKFTEQKMAEAVVATSAKLSRLISTA